MSLPIPTLKHLPQLSPRPTQAADHTGKRRGQMTAIAWARSSRSGKGTVWLCRCDCGLYEYRRPGTWGSRSCPEDMCAVCLQVKVLSGGPTTPQRRQAWADGLRAMGLSEAEIGRIQALGKQVQTRGCSLVEIREQLACCEGAGRRQTG